MFDPFSKARRGMMEQGRAQPEAPPAQGSRDLAPLGGHPWILGQVGPSSSP